jgi:hypothetical protein
MEDAGSRFNAHLQLGQHSINSQPRIRKLWNYRYIYICRGLNSPVAKKKPQIWIENTCTYALLLRCTLPLDHVSNRSQMTGLLAYSLALNVLATDSSVTTYHPRRNIYHRSWYTGLPHRARFERTFRSQSILGTRMVKIYELVRHFARRDKALEQGHSVKMRSQLESSKVLQKSS